MRTRYQFVVMLSQQNYTGDLKFNFTNGEVHVSVEPRPEDPDEDTLHAQTARQKVGVLNLSIVERMYATLSFRFAVWEAMACPFLCLDAIDASMDPATRKITIRMLIEHARKMSNRQFIVLSPLSFDFLEEEELDGDDVRIHRLRPHAGAHGPVY